MPVSVTDAMVSLPRYPARAGRGGYARPPFSPRAIYDPSTTRSVPRFPRMRASVSLAKLSASASARSSFMRTTCSPGTIRSFSPAASSVVSMSEKAADNQTASGRCERFLKPRTATDRRTVGGVETGVSAVDAAGLRAAHSANPAMAVVSTAMAAAVNTTCLVRRR